jgi:cobalt/nickel transport system permease protein
MTAALFSLWLPLGLHIHDGLLRAPWLAGGFVVAGGLALLASYRIREEEIPRIALLSAAFFVASLMHLPLGPVSVHLLLTGLVGVVLGRRAPLAILVGVGLQALFGHGGFTTIGVNACVQILPALLAGGLLAALSHLGPVRQRRYGVLWLLGCLIGMAAVLVALLLEAVVLLWGGAEDFGRIVQFVLLAHLPVVIVEGVVLGFTVSFLARVKPEMLGLDGRVGRVFEACHSPRMGSKTRLTLRQQQRLPPHPRPYWWQSSRS